MRTAFIIGAALSLAAASGAQAWAGALAAPRASVSGASLSEKSPPAVLVHRERRGLKPGMIVTDRHGAKVGVIFRTGQIRDGRPAVLLDHNGTRITVRASKLRLNHAGDKATLSLTRSQLRTATILNTD